jgi:nickel-dependent lactate racemase
MIGSAGDKSQEPNGVCPVVDVVAYLHHHAFIEVEAKAIIGIELRPMRTRINEFDIVIALKPHEANVATAERTRAVVNDREWFSDHACFGADSGL